MAKPKAPKEQKPEQLDQLKRPRTPVSSGVMRAKAKQYSTTGIKRHIISRCPSQLMAPQQHMFQVCRHILRKTRVKIYLKCCALKCKMAYITFNSVKELNAHHKVFHSNVTYKCPWCRKTLVTPNSLKFYQYCHKPKTHICPDCNKHFTYISKLQ